MRFPSRTAVSLSGRTLVIFFVTLSISSRATAQNTISTYAGGGAQSTTATSAYLPQPQSAVRDSAGNTYISVPTQNVVYVIDPNGIFSVYAGNGVAGFSGDGGAANQAQLNFPSGLAIDAKNNLFIADVNNNRIRRVDAQSHNITTVAGSEDPFFGAYAGDGGPATSARLNSPSNVAVDANGNLFIADSGNAVVRFVRAATQVITTYAGVNPAANAPFACSTGPATQTAFRNVVGIAVDSFGNVFVSDTSQDIVCKIDKSGNISLYAGTPGNPGTPGANNGDDGPATSAQLSLPKSLATDATGNLYITDSGNPKIRVVDTSTNHIITTVAGTGTICVNEPGCGDGGVAVRAELNGPSGVFVDPNNNILIADRGNMRVRVVSSSGGTIANLAGGGSGGDDGPATSAILGFAQVLAVDSNENLFALETAGKRLRVIDPNLNINTIAGSGVAGATVNCPQPNCNGDGGPASTARFVSPSALALDSQGNFYIADSGASVVRVINNSTTASLTVAGVTIQPGNIATVAGNGVQCAPGSSTYPTCGDDGLATSASLFLPDGIAVDPARNIYVADAGLHTVRIIDANGNINTFAGVAGQACVNFPGAQNVCEGGSPTTSLLNSPGGLAVFFSPQTQTTDLFIADTGDNVIRRVSTTSGTAVSQSISTAAFNGIATFGGDGLNATEASMYAPAFVAVDDLENLYISGGLDNVVRRVDAFTRDVSTVAGDITNLPGGFFGDRGLSTDALLENAGVAVFSSAQSPHDLFIADSGSNRIRKVNLAPTIVSQFPGIGGTVQFPVTLDGNSNEQFIDLENSSPGFDDVVLGPVMLSGDPTNSFTVSRFCFGNLQNIVPPNSGCSVQITFHPAVGVAGTISATLSFTTNDPANPTVSFTLTGVATSTTNQLIVTLTPKENSSTLGGTVRDESFSLISCSSSGSNSTCTNSYPSGSTVFLIASPDTGFVFGSWGGACASFGTSPFCEVTVDQTQTVTATFVTGGGGGGGGPQPTTLNIQVFGSGSGTLTDGTQSCTITNGSGNCSFSYLASMQGTTVTLTPMPDSNSKFVGWLGGECFPYNETTCAITLPGDTETFGVVFTGPVQQFAKGQVFLSTNFGMVFVLDPATGKVVQVLSSGNTAGQGQGMTFDAAGNLYLANSQANVVDQFSVNGTVLVQFGTQYQNPWSLLFQTSGDLLVGQPGISGEGFDQPTFLQFPATSNSQTNPSAKFFPGYETDFSQFRFSSASWIELLEAGDHVAYTSGLDTVQVYDLGELTQHADIITGLHGAFALRELPDDTLLVADSNRIVRIDQSGNILQPVYAIPGGTFQNLNLDPDGQTFWTNDQVSGTVYRVNIQSGAVVSSFNTTGLGSAPTSGIGTNIGGIAVFGQAQSGGTDLAVTMSAPTAVAVGANINYSITVANNGPINATNVTVITTIPNTTPVTLGNGCTASNGAQGETVACVIGNLAANSQASTSFTMLPNNPGTFTATATASGNESDPNLANNTATVTTSTGPACTLSVIPTSGVSPLTVNASATCSDAAGTISTTTLNFGDGTPVTNAATGSHIYSAAGTFTVTATATDNLSLTGTATQMVVVSPNLPPTCTLTVAPTSGLAPLAVTATGSCTDPENALSSTLLDFGDGTTQASPSGTHTYKTAGKFTVTLTGTDAVGQKGSATQTVTVTLNTAPTCTLTVAPLAGTVPLIVTATGNCVDAENNISTTVLDFGDGTTQVAPSGTHTYNSAGTFTVKLTATDSGGLVGMASQTVTASINNFPPGVFVGISGGIIKQLAGDGTVLKTINTGVAGTVAGMNFDKAGNLYVTDFTAGNVTEINLTSGTVIGSFGSGYNCQPESIVFDGAGNAYVGQQGCNHAVLKFDPSGKPLATYTVATEEQGSDDIALSADECTLLYTSEGPSILRFDVCKNQQLTPFATGLKKGLNLRILPDGGVIVADLLDIVRLSSTGQVLTTYTAANQSCLYSITLDQDGTSFWAGDYCSSNIYKFDINSGKQLTTFNTGTASGTVFGLAISGTGLNVAGLGSGGTLTASPSAATLSAGQSATFTVAFTPNAAAAGKTITLSCAGLPVGLTCSFSPPTITLGAAGTTTTAQMTISRTTTAELRHGASPWMLATWMGGLPAMVLMGIGTRRRRRGSLLWLGVIVACTGIWASCGGGTSMSNSSTSTPPTTPQGSFTVLVVGTASGAQASTTVTVTTQ